MAVSDQEVAAWLAANPLATDAQIAAAMDQYGVSSAQMARVTGLSVPVVEQRKAAAQRKELQSTFDPRVVEDQYRLPSQRTGTMAERGDDYQIVRPIEETKTLTTYQVYDVYGNPTGQFTQRNTSNLDDFLKAATMFGSVVGAPWLSSVIGAAAPTLSNAAVQGLTGATIGGGGTLLTGGSLEDALKNALIAGGTAYGASSLFGPTETATMADRGDVLTDVARLQQQGLSTNQIADILEFSGYSPELIDKGLAAVTTQTARPSVPSIVETPTNMVITGTAPINIPAIVGGATGGLLSNISAPSVTAPTKPAPSTAPNIEVVSKKPVDTSVIGGVVGGGLLTGDVTVPSVTAPTETVTNMPGAGENIEVVSDRPRQPPTIPYTPITETPVVPEITNITPIDIPEIVADNPNITLNDLLKIITTLTSIGAAGALGGGGGGGGNVPFVAPTQTMPVNTDDYYKAIQQYYNTYLPEMPRDVATPLQQWYSGTFKV